MLGGFDLLSEITHLKFVYSKQLLTAFQNEKNILESRHAESPQVNHVILQHVTHTLIAIQYSKMEERK